MRWVWIDRFEEFHSGQSAVAIKMVSRAEDHLYEQTPLYPVMPHSLILEGLAQTGESCWEKRMTSRKRWCWLR